MAANQRRKRLSSANVVGYSSREPYRVRKKNLALPHSDANLRSHITLVWDGSKRRVVSKREQIGISWRKLRPFVDLVSNEQTILADVFDVPREIFELEDLSEVLSLEVAIILWLPLLFVSKLSLSLLYFFLFIWPWIYCRFGRHIFQKMRGTILGSFFLENKKMRQMWWERCFRGIIFTLEIPLLNGKYSPHHHFYYLLSIFIFLGKYQCTSFCYVLFG